MSWIEPPVAPLRLSTISAFYSYVIPVLVFVTVVETWVMARALGAPWREVWRVARDANLWSGLAGFPVSVANASLGALLPDDLHGYFARLPWVSALGYGTQLAATLVVEGLYWRRAQPVRGRPRARWLRGVLLANLATYGVLAPLHYWISRPGVRGISCGSGPTAAGSSS